MKDVKENLENNKVEIQNKEEYIVDYITQKKVSILLIIIFLILIYVSTFFIHDIVDNGGSKDNEEVIVTNPDTVIDSSARFKLKQGEIEFRELKELDIFKNKYFDNESIIAPGVSGRYSFTVENESENEFNYDIEFIEENPYEINMVFKLRVNGEYVIGNEKNWVKGGKLVRNEMLLKANNKDIYTIEWKWEHTDNDTEIGEQGGPGGAYYKMKVKATAEQVIK